MKYNINCTPALFLIHILLNATIYSYIKSNVDLCPYICLCVFLILVCHNLCLSSHIYLFYHLCLACHNLCLFCPPCLSCHSPDLYLSCSLCCLSHHACISLCHHLCQPCPRDSLIDVGLSLLFFSVINNDRKS